MPREPGPGGEGSWATLGEEHGRKHGWKSGADKDSGAPSEKKHNRRHVYSPLQLEVC